MISARSRLNSPRMLPATLCASPLLCALHQLVQVALHGLLPGWALHVLALLIAVLIFTVGTTRVGIPLYTLATHLLIGVALPSLVARWLIARMTAQPAGPQSDSTVGRRTAPKVSTTDTQQPSEAASAEPEDAPSKPETAQRQGSVAQVPQQGSGEEAAATQSRAASAARCTGLVPYQSCLPGPFSVSIATGPCNLLRASRQRRVHSQAAII